MALVERPAAPAPAQLAHPFRALIFDWDGTAVVSRQEDATLLVRQLERLLRRRVWIVVVTGTNFGHIDRQLCQHVAPRLRHHLLVCTNRGSEVYGFDARGALVDRRRRIATPEEECALTAIAEAVRDRIQARTGLPIRLVYDRLNRRKIDLIPEPQWADPPKARIGELLAAVEQRLRGAGLAGGLGEAVALTERLAREHGLPDARITTDVKHVEVGLTDKGDSLAWLREHLLGPEEIAPREVLVAGDEFGPLAGFAGSDDRLRGGVPGALVVSVGAEPNGVPEGVLHLAGGPARFRALLAEQVCLHRAAQRRIASRVSPAASAARALAAPVDPAWQLAEQGYEPALEHEVESCFAIGNGLIGVRGSLETPTRASRPRAFVAGVFDTPAGPFAVPTLVPGPDWTRLRLRVDGQPLAVTTGEILAHGRVLDWQRGLLLGEWRHRLPGGQVVQVRTLRLASLAERSLALQVAQINVEQPTPLALETRIEPPKALIPLGADHELASWRTTGGAHQLALATSTRLYLDGHPLPPTVNGRQTRAWEWSGRGGECATLLRLVATTRDAAAGAPDAGARAVLRRAERRGLSRLLAEHTGAWQARWAVSDVAVEGDPIAQRALRFAAYHLISAANPADERVSIGARALTGDAYLGHVFWDTESFLLPFYTLTWPAAARALLMYRYHTLPAARDKAARLGYRGALYAWESAGDGAEATPTHVLDPHGQVVEIRCGTEEQHISADVAYAVWQYWQATGDTRFLRDAGAEILLETARFWASRAVLEADGRYHIRNVIGPDEYHEGVDDNAYTNIMAAWNLERGLATATLLERRWPAQWDALRAPLGLTADEFAVWREVAARLAVHEDPASGLIEQFEGFFGLETIDLAAYAGRAVPMDVLLGPERTRRSQVIKQADVMMLLALLPERYPRAAQETNYRYYEPRCGHGSSLSPAAHALVAARLGDAEGALRYFHQAAAIDLDDTMGNAAQGVHVATLGGLWQAAVLGFAGLGLAADGLRLAPCLPASWQRLRFAVEWHGRRVRVEIERESHSVTATLERGHPLALHLGEHRHRLRRGEPWVGSWHELAESGAAEGRGR